MPMLDSWKTLKVTMRSKLTVIIIILFILQYLLEMTNTFF